MLVRAFLFACLALAPASANATEPTAPDTLEVECYDAEVSARIVAQVPTIPPEFDDGSIVMRWLWFIDLDVRTVRTGQAPSGIISTLAVQHTYWRKDLGVTRWHLRRNSQGGYNLLGRAEGASRRQCASDVPPAPPFLGTDDPAMLDTLRREGEARYGRRK
jgi:hypothetical protein